LAQLPEVKEAVTHPADTDLVVVGLLDSPGTLARAEVS
jgi:hypothetical protein